MPQDSAVLNNPAWFLFERGESLAEAEGLAPSRSGRRRAIYATDTPAQVLVAQGLCSEAAATIERALVPAHGRALLEPARRRLATRGEAGPVGR